MSDARQWPVHGHLFEEGFWLGVSPWPRTAEAFNPGREVAAAVAVEDPDGDYMGWLATGETEIDLIQRRSIFDIQFPWGHRPEVEAGRVEAVPLRIESDVP